MVSEESKKSRIIELDFLRSIAIILMVMFHLVYFADRHLLLKQFVYTFHMPIFLLISGYLCTTKKTTKDYLKSLAFLLLPYIIMESGYTIMAALLPIREHIDNLTIEVFFNKVFLHPIGPYWFIHTLILLQIIILISSRLAKSQTIEFISILIILSLVLSHPKNAILSFNNAVYFIVGAIIKITKINILKPFTINPLPIILLTILCINPDYFNRGTFAGFIIVWLVIASLLFIYNHIKVPHLIIYIGRNTLPILLFSPIFTLLVKQLIPFFSFDPTAIIFMIVATTIVIAGSLAIAFIMDYTHISRLFAGKKLLV